MNREQILKMAKEANKVSLSQWTTEELERFAALVAADEREECAKIAWNYEADENGLIETAIRARGRNEMTTEWKDLPDLQAVAIAQKSGWEIEEYWNSTYSAWNNRAWSDSSSYRGRPAQPKTRTVKLLAYFNGEDLVLTTATDHDWKRVPAEDKTIEVSE